MADNPVQDLWESRFPFSYWDNRIERISRYNSEDNMEALFVLLQLSDLFAHLVSAYLRNPNQMWLLLREETYGHHIQEVLDKLSTETEEHGSVVTVSKLADEPEGLATLNQIREVDATDTEMVARSYFGCPAYYDEEDQALEFLDDPETYLGMVNAGLNFWRENKALLNDFKHGFRIIPADRDTIRWLEEQNLFQGQEEEVDQLLEEMRDNESEGWGFHFVRMYSEKIDEKQYEVYLNLRYADTGMCTELSKILLRLIANMMNPYRRITIQDHMENLVAYSDGDIEEGIEVFYKLAGMEIFYTPPQFRDSEE